MFQPDCGYWVLSGDAANMGIAATMRTLSMAVVPATRLSLLGSAQQTRGLAYDLW
jgi:hypothetical protein